MMTVKKGNGKFFVGNNEQNPAAEITFKVLDDDRVEAVRTFVSGEYASLGIADKLLEAIVQYAREENRKIVPSSMYVRRELKNNSAYQDVLAK